MKVNNVYAEEIPKWKGSKAAEKIMTGRCLLRYF